MIFGLKIAILALASSFLISLPCARAESSLQEKITAGISKIEAFQFLKEEAKKLGIRVWLNGGTATGFAVYARDNPSNSKNSSWGLDSIYRSNQDLDLVVDGSAETMAKLKNIMESKFPVFRGSKSAWDFGLMNEALGTRIARTSPDYILQNNDSYSTGLIEITDPPKGQERVLDLIPPHVNSQGFLKDLESKEISLYISPGHANTKLSLEGKNPDIFEVIRFLSKAFQYDAKIKESDLNEVKKIVDSFRPQDFPLNSYTSNRLEDLGTKLFMNARDLEPAWNLVDKIGLRKKFIELGTKDEAGTLAWLANRVPLPSNIIPEVSNLKTAEQLFLELGRKDLIISHETFDLGAYESILAGKDGIPNFYTSHQNGYHGEVAKFGDGVYALPGREGAKGTGITIRMTLNPKARLGIDFDYKNGNIILKNRNAVQIIKENLADSIDLNAIIQSRALPAFMESDLGIKARFKESVVHQLLPLLKKEINRLLDTPTKNSPAEIIKLLQLLPNEQYWKNLLDEHSLPKLAAMINYSSLDPQIVKLYQINMSTQLSEFTDPKKLSLVQEIANLVKQEASKPKPDTRYLRNLISPITNSRDLNLIANALLPSIKEESQKAGDTFSSELMQIWFAQAASDAHPKILADFLKREMSQKRALVLIRTVFSNDSLMNSIPLNQQSSILEIALPYLQSASDQRSLSSSEMKSIVVNIAKSKAFQNSDWLYQALEKEFDKKKTSTLAGELIENALPYLTNTEDPKIWKLLTERINDKRFYFSNFATALATPELSHSKAAEAWVQHLMESCATDSSNSGWLQDNLMSTMMQLLSNKEWLEKPAAKAWMATLLTMNSPLRNADFDKSMASFLSTELAKSSPLHSSWVQALGTPRTYRSLGETPKSACPSLYQALWNPLGRSR